MTSAAATQEAPKNLALGRNKKQEAAHFIAAAQQVAEETNVPTKLYPHAKQPTPPAHAPQPQPTTQPEHPPEHEQPTAMEATPPPIERKGRGPRPAHVRRYSVDLPVYVIDTIIDVAHRKRTTKKRVFLEALNAGGITVKDIDIAESGPVLRKKAHP